MIIIHSSQTFGYLRMVTPILAIISVTSQREVMIKLHQTRPDSVHSSGGCHWFYHRNSTITGWWFEPLWKKWKSIGMMTFPIYGKIKLMFQTTNQITFQQETWSIGELAAFLLVESRSKSIATDRSDGEVTWFQCRFWSSMPCWESEDHGYLSIPYHEYLWINGFKWLVIHTRWCPSSLAKLVYKYYNVWVVRERSVGL